MFYVLYPFLTYLLTLPRRRVWSNSGIMVSKGNSQRNLFQCHFIDHEFYMKSRGTELEAPLSESDL
jgi:hypothetical protein